jgi:hypothetical protein
MREKLADVPFVNKARKRLTNLGWFMKCLKEPLARIANREDKCQGAFWQGRYKSIAVLDEEALLATCIYIDLNPLAAGISQEPDKSDHTSIRTRVEHCRALGRMRDLQAAREGSVAGIKQSRGLEAGLWLCPIEDRRRQRGGRAGLMEGFSLGTYLQLVEYTSRLARSGKARVSQEVPTILDRLRCGKDGWNRTIRRLFDRPRQLGVAFAFRRERLQNAAQQRGCHHVANLNGCPA